MRIGIKKVLQSPTEVLGSKVPNTISGLVGTSLVSSGLYKLSKVGTQAIINSKEDKPQLEVEN
jgi:hypothetical protein